ncbi:hypothetical protein GJ496_010221 [Pomphorhynchus laevis]|nr:hypothetical protein GJ496_010221 [Pomphorhynchus laevis]
MCINILKSRPFIQCIFKRRLGRPGLYVRIPSAYSKDYVDPCTNLDELNQIDEYDERRFRPIKAPKMTDSFTFFYDKQMQRLVNILMKEGDQETAQEIVHKAMYQLKLKQVAKLNEVETSSKTTDILSSIETNPIVLFHNAIKELKPVVSIARTVRGGVGYTVPVPISDSYAEFLAIKWLTTTARDDKKSDLRIWERLAREVLDAIEHTGLAYSKKIELQKTAEVNRAFAHFRWLK